MAITDPITGYVVRGVDYMLGTPQLSFRDDDIRDFLQAIWDKYAPKLDWQLVSISHARCSPWDQVSNFRNSEAGANTGFGGKYVNLVIPVELMRAYFKSLLSETS
ncbi:MAG: hypothetical protein LBQ12_05105 [Deltaproteobacteria bacterium]|jgi:uncharacterized phage-associated protein|nr:hypothetical protein [Deltaproteobacteria bacterium]